MLHRLTGGGLWLRLEAGLIGHTADYTTLKSSSGSGATEIMSIGSVDRLCPPVSDTDISSSRQGGICNPTPCGCHAVVFHLYKSRPLPSPKGEGFTDPLSGTLNSGRRIEVEEDLDADLLKKLVAVLEASRCSQWERPRISVCTGSTDIRKGFDGLYGLIPDRMDCDQRSHLSICKCAPQPPAACPFRWLRAMVCSKRAEGGRLHWPESIAGKVQLSREHFTNLTGASTWFRHAHASGITSPPRRGIT